MFGRRKNKRRRVPSLPLSSRLPRGMGKNAWLLWGGIIFGALLIGGGVSFGLFFFKIDTIEIRTDESDVNLQHAKLQLMMESAKKENLLFLSSSFLKKQLFLSFPELKDITIRKKFPRTLVLEPDTDPLVFKWIYKISQDPDHQYFGYVSEKGLYFKHGPDEIFTIFENDPRDQYILPISVLLSAEEIKNIQSSKNLLEQTTQRKITKMYYLRNAQEIHFVDEKNVEYWIFLKYESADQIEKLAQVLEQQDIYKTPLEYIDLRIGRKVIYKPKSS